MIRCELTVSGEGHHAVANLNGKMIWSEVDGFGRFTDEKALSWFVDALTRALETQGYDGL